MKLSRIDLELLRVLHVVLAERSVVAAARVLHVTPPAVSNALSRLRGQLGDPLFVRRGRGLTATPRALELAPVLARAFGELDTALEAHDATDPASTTRELSIALSDADQLTSLQPIVRAFAERFPKASLRVVTIDRLVGTDGLAEGGVEVTIAPPFEAEGLRSRPLFREDGVLVVRRDHPRVKRTLTARAFDAEGHVDIHLLGGKPGAGNRTVAKAIADAGLTRRVAVTVPTFAACAAVVASSDLIGGLPRRVAELYARALPLRVVSAPGPAITFQMCLHWHERTHLDPIARAFRELVVDALGDADARGAKGAKGAKGARNRAQGRARRDA